MNHGLDTVREMVGSAEATGIPDSAIRDALWEYYFDVNQTIDWVFGKP
jgi:elongation factor 1 alpha-like protein